MNGNKTGFAILGLVMLTAACTNAESDDRATTSRYGEYTVRTVVEGDLVESEIHRGDRLIAVASVDGEQASVTSLDSGVEVLSTVPIDIDDLEAYQSSLADVGNALELQSVDEEFRNADCGYAQFTGGLGQLCIASWCSGTSCHAIDCAPAANGCGEVHYIAPECSIV